MNRQKLIRVLAGDPRIGNPHLAVNALAAIEDAITAELQRGRPVALDRFGTWVAVLRTLPEAPVAPAGKPAPPRAHKTVIFRPASDLRARVNGQTPAAERRAS